jgi:stalled ribosome rescue protein Dom34
MTGSRKSVPEGDEPEIMTGVLQEEADRLAIVHLFRMQLAAMQRGDITALSELLNPDFTLTHITGYIQPKDEWLSQMQSGQFIYHHIDENSISVDLHADKARLVGRLIVDATVYGSRATWQLQLTQHLSRRKERWTIDDSLATPW